MRQLDRVLRILQELPQGPCRQGGPDAPTLAAQLGVTTRTIHRDMQAMRENGYMVEAQPGGGYYLHAVIPS